MASWTAASSGAGLPRLPDSVLIWVTIYLTQVGWFWRGIVSGSGHTIGTENFTRLTDDASFLDANSPPMPIAMMRSPALPVPSDESTVVKAISNSI